MSSNHLISSFITSVKNAASVKKSSVSVPYSKVLLSISDILVAEGFVKSYAVEEVRKGISVINIQLKYVEGRHSIQDFKVVSTPGCRSYTSIAKLRPCYDSLGFYIVSTSKGVVTDFKARELGVGGEILCKVF